MTRSTADHRTPREIAVVGAGIVGLSTAWHLQERGCEVTVLDRTGIAAGASWGNAGWLTPSLTVPLPHPSILTYGLRALFDRHSPLYVPLRPRLSLMRFLLAFARHSTLRRWQMAMHAYVPLSRPALGAFEELLDGDVRSLVKDAEPFLASFRTSDERDTWVDGLRHVTSAGLPVTYELIDRDEAHRSEPGLAATIRAAVRVHGQRYLHPPRFVAALAESLTDRGVRIEAPRRVDALRDQGRAVTLRTDAGELSYDAVVLATGAWLPALAKPFGVRHPMHAGRGYSFSVASEVPLQGPVYFPGQRIACTPLGDRLRVAGMMEFRRADAPLDQRRIQTLAAEAAPLLNGVDLTSRQDEWVGSRPVTGDGLPLIGPTRSPRVHVAGGHGMWGVVLGPITGKLLADSIIEGRTRPELAPFNPLRR